MHAATQLDEGHRPSLDDLNFVICPTGKVWSVKGSPLGVSETFNSSADAEAAAIRAARRIASLGLGVRVETHDRDGHVVSSRRFAG